MAINTICALASASGKAGVSVVRISGPEAMVILEQLTHKRLPKSHRFSLRTLFHPKDKEYLDPLDEALIVLMSGPNSFTGEDVVELHLHGGIAIVEAVLEACFATKLCRMAEPGEFTRRAFENGRMDLTKAEAIGDLIDAETQAQRRQAIQQYDGAFYSKCLKWRTDLINAMASLDAAIDFPDEEDVPAGIDSRAFPIVQGLLSSITSALKNANAGLAVRDGFKISIIGPPNAGKSTLMNALAGREAAIVSSIPGTTRDIVEVRLELGGYIVWLSDTAGLRDTNDEIEAEGVKRALVRAAESDLRIYLHGIDQPAPDLTFAKECDFLLMNKVDLPESQRVENVTNAKVFKNRELIERRVSLKSSEDIKEIKSLLEKVVVDRMSTGSAAPLISRQRHKQLLMSAQENLEHAIMAMENNFPADLIAEDIRLAARDIGKITGEIDSEDVLDRIFGEFCIGK
ncbi:tRNA uridine-5-carboxymethylaminomethyl(34) synthesis GTPase MnmE [Hirschia litorea]|uniref:tRNA modification GTPase MnmE n=1 Tax=Hirschia litorea TaxID=1199156 RepID=A0ABW2IMY8_9PROT